MNKYLILAITFMLNYSHVKSQTQVFDNNRTSLKWERIKTDDFNIIFPKGFASEAQRVANTLQHIHDPLDKSLGTHTRRATILLQNQNSIANGFVTLGPRRSEFYTSAPQDYNFLGTNDWLNTLAVHEYRHLVQFNKSRTGFNKLFYYLFGQNTQAAMANVAAPAWFWEGDATVAETAFTRSGRGRIPDFNRIFRANLLEGKRFDYHKQSLRSYKDFVPNHYVLGYHMVSHIRKKTSNPNVFSDITRKTWNVPFIPFRFSSAIKKSTGKYVVDNYEEMMDELADQWKKQLSTVDISPFERINHRKNRTYTDYTNPSQMANGRILIHKFGIGDIDEYILISEDGTEEKIHTPGILNVSGMLSVAGNTVAWNEFTFDRRWRNQSYSVIRTYNYDTKTLKTVTQKSRYHGSSLSPDTRYIATVEALQDGTYRMVVLDANTGSVTNTFANSTKGLLTLPAWSSDGKSITFLSNYSGKKSVQIIDVETGKESTLIDAGTENIGNPALIGDYLFYQSDYSGIDNIYALHMATNKKYQVTSSKYGAYNFAVSNDQKQIFYNDHTADGLDLVKAKYDPTSWKPIDQISPNPTGYYTVLEDQEQHAHILDSVPNTTHKVEKYSPLRGLINPHSWGPFLNANDLNQAQLGVFSRDVLSTTSIYAGYGYNASTGDGAMMGRISYQGFYPILDVEFSKGNRTDDKSSWDEQTVTYGVRVPLLLTKSKYHTQLTFGNSVGHTTVTNYTNGVNELGRQFEFKRANTDGDSIRVRGMNIGDLDNGLLIFNKFNISYFRLLKRSIRDINSRFGQSFVFEQFNTLSGDYTGSLTALRGSLFFPGIFKHHSFYIRGSLQSRKVTDASNVYAFPARVFRPRGYEAYPVDKSSSLIQFNYSLPLWYPDFSVGPLLNIKRIKANLFTDLGRSKEVRYWQTSLVDDPGVRGQQMTETFADFTSFGAELTFDINIMRFLPEFELGVRYSYTGANVYFPQEATKIEFIVGGISL